MIKSVKVMLKPNNKQNTKLFKNASVSRFAYNWTLQKQKENYEKGGKFLSDNDLRKEFTLLKKEDGYKWLNEYSNNIPKQAIKEEFQAVEIPEMNIQLLASSKTKKVLKPIYNKNIAWHKEYQESQLKNYNSNNLKFENKHVSNTMIVNYTKYFIDDNRFMSVKPLLDGCPHSYFEHVRTRKLLVDNENKILLCLKKK